MRRLASLFVILCLAFTFTACPGGGGGKKKEEKKNGGESGGGGGGEQSGGGGGASPVGSLADDLAHIRDDARRTEPDPDLLKAGLNPGDLAKGATGPGPLVNIDGVTPADVIAGSGGERKGMALAVTVLGDGPESTRFERLRREFPGFLDGNRLSREGEQFLQQLEQIPVGDGAIENYRRRQREFGPALRAMIERNARNAPPTPLPTVTVAPPPVLPGPTPGTH